MSRGGRGLRDEERELWTGITRLIKPLKPQTQSRHQI